MGKKTRPLSLTEEQRNRLETWVRAKTTPQRVAFRAQICLLSAEGLSDTEIANRMNTSRPTVLVWKRRFEEEGPDSLAKDAPQRTQHAQVGRCHEAGHRGSHTQYLTG